MKNKKLKLMIELISKNEMILIPKVLIKIGIIV